MGLTGTIKEIKTDDGLIIASVETLVTNKAGGQALSVVVGQAAGMECHPCVGDTVYFDRHGQEYVALALFSQDTAAAAGEVYLFSRSAPDVIAATVHLKADGKIEIKPGTGQPASVGNGGDWVAMATVTDQKIQAIADAITNAAVGSADGGAAFKANITAAMNPALIALGSAASTNLKAD